MFNLPGIIVPAGDFTCPPNQGKTVSKIHRLRGQSEMFALNYPVIPANVP
jgi:hypothetical protein